VRTWIQTLFPAGTAPTSRTAILNAVTRPANNVEAALASAATGPAGGNGSAQNQSAVLNYEGGVTGDDISDIKGLPA
jgi:hypothetical protein